MDDPHARAIQQELERLRYRASHPDTAQQLLQYLERHSGPWPATDLLLCYQSIWKALPEHIKCGRKTSRHGIHEQLHARVKQNLPTLAGILSRGDGSRAAIIDVKSGVNISHEAVQQFVHSFNLGLEGFCHRKPRVAVILPNGPMMALACLAVTARYTLVPMTTTVAPHQLLMDIEQVNPDAIVTLEENIDMVEFDPEIAVFIARPEPDLTFTVSCHTSHRVCNGQQPSPHTPDDLALVLFTSGTSGRKKLVPITAFSLIASTLLTMSSLGLSVNDCCLNMMPLNHIGGITRSLLASIVAGGAVICCPSFDPSMFWDAIGQWNPSWYYAAPTMHQMILAESEHRQEAVQASKIRLICNAAAGLPPTVATNLRETFRCSIFPSYGMTECTPIAAPPLEYQLDRPGTSGIEAGPELAILETFDSSNPVPTGVTGRVCVRGIPVFPGYVTADGLDRRAFGTAGWFDTGDLGYMDSAGYLFVTGRSKEVINRGGEIISPVEVEDAIFTASKDPSSFLFGRIAETLAFAVPHDMLQEVVGVVVVVPQGKTRPDIRQLHEALQSYLPQPKLPMLVVYMGGLPKSNNKLQRIQLSQRLQLAVLTDSTLPADRHYEAECPPLNTPLTEVIPSRKCVDPASMLHVSPSACESMPDILMRRNKADGFPQAIVFFRGQQTVNSDDIISHLRAERHGYLVPGSVKCLHGSLPLDDEGRVVEELVDEAIRQQSPQSGLSVVEERVRELFGSALGRQLDDVDSLTDFFAAGGDSLGAGRLVSQLRREFQIHLPGDILFHHSTLAALARVVEDAVLAQPVKVEQNDELPGCSETHSSTNPLVLLIHLIPIAVLYPMRHALQWVLFINAMAETSFRFPLRTLLIGRLTHVVIIAAGVRLVVQLVVPLIGVLLKWVIIGRYEPGIYPMWGVYHTRWWLTQKALQICGRGAYDQFNWSRKLYLRALGAKIGRNVTIHELASLGEYDLIELGDNVTLDHCICRPFAVERHTSMLLGAIRIRNECCIGLKSVVAPGTDLAPGTCLGPNSSSWEAEDAQESNRGLLSPVMPECHWLFNLLLVTPAYVFVGLARRLPWLAGLVPIVVKYPTPGEDTMHQTVIWFTNPRRVAYHILARLYLAVAGPLVMFAAILVIKRLLDYTCRRAKPGPLHKQSQLQKVRSTTLACILPQGDLHTLTHLFGRHYEVVSVLARAMGARVGQRVYWPGVFPSVQDFDLLDIGNDVVFGSRSHLVTSDGLGKDRVVIEDGAMIGDRAVLLPGVTVGTRTMVGSGSLLRRNGLYPADTVWTGSRKGDAIPFPTPSRNLSEAADDKFLDSTTRPFGRAFYLGQATYHVLGLVDVVCYSVFLVALVTVYWVVTALAGLLVLRRVFDLALPVFEVQWWRPFLVYALFAGAISICSMLQAILALLIVILAKWALLGRRQEGEYHWDKSSYNQRWQLFLAIESIIKDCYGGLGILQLLSGTWYLVVYYRAMGARIGRDCALFANGDPHIYFTEPDLLTLGERVAVDDASLVGHINSRGEFELHKLQVGDRSVLRTGSRLMSGASMGSDACLLEHTLVLSGDHVEDGQTLQGWPAGLFEGSRI